MRMSQQADLQLAHNCTFPDWAACLILSTGKSPIVCCSVAGLCDSQMCICRQDSTWRCFWDLPATAAFILSQGYVRVALQFPDELLIDASEVAGALQQELAASGHTAQVRAHHVKAHRAANCCTSSRQPALRLQSEELQMRMNSLKAWHVGCCWSQVHVSGV